MSPNSAQFRASLSDERLILCTARALGLRVIPSGSDGDVAFRFSVACDGQTIVMLYDDDPTSSPFRRQGEGIVVSYVKLPAIIPQIESGNRESHAEPSEASAWDQPSRLLIETLDRMARQAHSDAEGAVNRAVVHARQWDLESESLFLNLNRAIHSIFAPDFLEMRLQRISEYWPGRSDDAVWTDPPMPENRHIRALAERYLRLTYRRDQVVLTEDSEAVDLDQHDDEGAEQTFTTGLTIPLIWRGTRLGALRLYYHRKVEPLPYEVEVLEHFRREFSFILDRTRIHLQTLRMAATDGLTGLFNHRFYREQLRTEFRRAKRYQKMMSLIMIDIDDFKSYNDSHGHLAGDRVLVEVARTIRGAVRDIDFVARYGGEEFALVLPEVNAESGMIVAEKIRRAIEQQRFQLDDGEPIGSITVSCGVTDNSRAESAEELMEQADQALYWVKRHGRNLVKLAQVEQHDE